MRIFLRGIQDRLDTFTRAWKTRPAQLSSTCHRVLHVSVATFPSLCFTLAFRVKPVLTTSCSANYSLHYSGLAQDRCGQPRTSLSQQCFKLEFSPHPLKKKKKNLLLYPPKLSCGAQCIFFGCCLGSLPFGVSVALSGWSCVFYSIEKSLSVFQEVG